MSNGDGLTVRVEPTPEGDTEELADLTALLRAELLELDVDSVDPVAAEAAPEQAKGVAELVGWLAVRFGPVGLRAVVSTVHRWAAQTNRVVEVSVGGDVLKLTGVTSEQQDRIIDGWLTRHAAST